ncbi:hypothetical protein Ae201684P_004351 [Aphanomyces euteiches]|nr:hypothetical protein Ae201684P_004351 [Aphanomyces euteiches]KAH9154102.1 hypothetical protein AeRB84_003749 [Aphanomyces euteiches]
MNQRYLNPLVAVIPHDKTLALSTEQASWGPRLPPNVGLTSLELADRPYCIRLRRTHLFAVNEHSVWSKNAEVDLALLLQNFSSKFQIHELGLTGNLVLREMKGTMIVMKAMHVRAFQVCSTKHAIFDASDAGLDGSAAALSLLNDG